MVHNDPKESLKKMKRSPLHVSLKFGVIGVLLFHQAAFSAPKSSFVSQKELQNLAEYHFSLAQGYSGEGDLDKAIEEYRLALVFDPGSAFLYARLAAEYVKKGMLSAALETAQEAIKKNPKFVDARLILAGLYSAMHESKLAIREYDQVLKYDPKNEEAVVFKAQVLTEDDQNLAALAVLKNFVKTHPDSPVAFYYLAKSEEQEGHIEQAVRD